MAAEKAAEAKAATAKVWGSLGIVLLIEYISIMIPSPSFCLWTFDWLGC